MAHDEGARKNPARPSVPERVAAAGGLRPGVARAVADQTAVPEAHVYGVASFFHLLADPDHPLRVCQGLSCRLAGAEGLLERARARGLPATGCSCLAVCDRPVAVLRDRATLSEVSGVEIDSLADWRELRADADAGFEDATTIGCRPDDPERLVFRLAEPARYEGRGFRLAQEMGAPDVIARITASGLQGRGGAAFPAGVKWQSVVAQADATRYVVLNADEGEPGTFKDRELLARRPDLVVEGLAIAAATIGAHDVYCYLRGEFDRPWAALAAALAECDRRGLYPDVEFHLHAGQGAYICGEETALLEALEGKRGMPRLKPPFPTENGLWGRPTLMHNVETIACVPAILERGAEWFAGLGRTGPGTKLYCLSGHVAAPGVYEMPLGVSLDELVAAAGGYRGAAQGVLAGRRELRLPPGVRARCGRSTSRRSPRSVRCSARPVWSCSTRRSTWPGRCASRCSSSRRRAAGSARPAASAPVSSARRSTASSRRAVAATPPGPAPPWRRSRMRRGR